MNLKDIPSDVWFAWSYQEYGLPMGLETYERVKKIIEQYPEYFPWETKYNSIPKAVHEAYFNEVHGRSKLVWAGAITEPHPADGFKGILPTIMEKEKPPASNFSMEDLHKAFMDIAKREDMERLRKRKQYEKDKAIWDKYYKPYGLEYRK